MTNNSRMKQAWDSRTAFWIAAIFVAVIVILAVVILINGHGDGEPKSKPASTPSASASTGTAASDDPMKQQFVTLPTPTKMTNGYPTYYPHTTGGAVATVLAFSMASSQTLDYSEATKVVDTYATGLPAGMSSSQLANASVAQIRKQLKLPVGGDAPAGASAKVTIGGVKWRTGPGSDITVSGDVSTTYTLPSGETSTYTNAVVLGAAKWVKDRWMLDGSAGVAGSESTDYVEPGSAAFINGGWHVITNSDWTGGLL